MKWFRRTPLESARWAVIDCETSGLDAERDRLLSVGAIAVSGGEIRLADCFSALVAQPFPSAPENILVHGIGGDAQRAGRPLPQVLAELRAYVADAVPVAFHAPFDESVLRRHGLKLAHRWLDLATLIPAVFSDRRTGLAGLDEWLAEFGIPPQDRHDALGDAFAAAQLRLAALARLKREGLGTVQDLIKAERDARWLARH
jgi:DNA polymerase-3 subunit epsilon